MNIHDRVIADLGTNPEGTSTGFDHSEPALAMTRRVRVAANHGLATGVKNRGLSGTNQDASWSAAPIGATGTYRCVDASIAVIDQELDTFVLFGMTSITSGSIRYSVYTSSTGFSSWNPAYLASDGHPMGSPRTDKPWVVRRAANDFLVFFWRGGDYAYLRTPIGDNWTNPDGSPLLPRVVATVAGEEAVTSYFCCQPSVAKDGTVLLAHANGPLGPPAFGKIRILIGTNAPSDPTGHLEFRYMKDALGNLIQWTPRIHQQTPPIETSDDSVYDTKTVPYIVCDPSNDDYAYVFYHDTDLNDPEDVNVYVVILHRVGGSWSMGGPTRIDIEAIRPSDLRGADQHTPVAAVDKQGRIHVLYYDNRASDGLDGWGAEYDAYYAISTDHGGSFASYCLRPNTDSKPAMNLDIREANGSAGVAAAWSAREYNGIALYGTPETVRVWVTYTGTAMSSEDRPNSRGVTFGQQIVVTSP